MLVLSSSRIVAIFYPFSQLCEIIISLLSLRKQPNTAPNLFQRGLEYGKYESRRDLWDQQKPISGLNLLVCASNTEGYGFVEFVISSSTVSTAFCQPLSPRSRPRPRPLPRPRLRQTIFVACALSPEKLCPKYGSSYTSCDCKRQFLIASPNQYGAELQTAPFSVMVFTTETRLLLPRPWPRPRAKYCGL